MKTPSRFILYAIVFFAFFDLFAQLPIMSTFALSVGASSFIAGFSIAIYSLTNTFGNVLSGIWTDKKGPYRVLVLGLFLTSLSLLAYQFVDSPSILLIVRCVHGFMAGLIVPAAFTLSANITAMNRQGKKVAITGSFVGLAAIIGPAFSGIVASVTSPPTVFLFVSLFGWVILFVTIVTMRRSQTADSKKDTHTAPIKPDPKVIRAYWGAFFLMFSQGALAFLLPVHVQELGYDSRLSGTLLSMFGVVAVLFFLLPTNRLFDRFSPTKLTALGVAIIGTCQMLIGQAGIQTSLYGVLALYGVGFAILFPAINTLLIQSTSPQNRGKAYGAFYAFFSLGTVAGSSFLSALPLSVVEQFTLTGLILWGASLLFLVSVVKGRRIF
ncbi:MULTISPECIES: MFS transporter [unclassified Exiguobacterium]|uniref:MFS transporter n=1 Tax=unclassified Exiguobacterium TaxID=2644629 RepID=UPI001BE825D0|nr:MULTISPECIES: MFS transporter [unclassified Exiguobacterium]